MQVRHDKPARKPRRRRLLLVSIIAMAVLGGGTSVAVALSSAGQAPLGEPLPAETTVTNSPPVTSGPEVSESAAVAMAVKEAHTESTASGGSSEAIQAATTPQAVAHTTRKIATDTIGQGQEPANASPEVAAWYEGSVYLVAFQGNYVAHDAPVPPGASAPTGHYLTLVVDAYSGKITGYELSETRNLAPDVGAIAKGS